jgi:hypothetical protein
MAHQLSPSERPPFPGSTYKFIPDLILPPSLFDRRSFVTASLKLCTLAQRVIFLPAAANSFRSPQFPWVRIFLKTFLLRLATAVRRDTFLQEAANFLLDPHFPQASSFGSPRHPRARCRPLAASSLFPEISLRPFP